MKPVSVVLVYLGLVVLLTGAARNARAVGAVTPFISYEAEAGTLGGGATVVSLTAPPPDQFSSPELEASGHAFVQLTNTGAYVEWTNNTGTNITAINLRSCIPDAPTGGGIAATIDLYVNGTMRQAFSVNSQQNYCYEGTNYNGQADKNPTDGDPRGFWNDTHAFIMGSPVAPGSTIAFQKDSINTAAFYDIDVIDLEAPPAPSSQPANSLSIASYGAVSNNMAADNTSAINNCFKAAQNQGKIAWIPPGTFYFSGINGGLNAASITIEGAGPWYSTLYRVVSATNQQGVANIITTTSSTLRDLALDCNAYSRANNNNNGAVNFSGTNWLVTNVWIQHATSAFWCAGVNGMACNCRVLSTWADGGNFNNVQNSGGIGMNLTYSNNFVRGTGDDAMAINSVNYNVYGSGTNASTNYYTIMSNIVYVNNTTIDPWGGKGLGLYGGVNDLATNNLLLDSARYMGLGVMRFGVNGSDLLSAVVMGNTLLRCGANGYAQQQQALMIGNGGDAQGVGTVANVYCASNTIIDAMYDGVGFSTSTNIVLQYNTITNPGLNGIAPGAPDLGTGVAGFAMINFNTVTGLNPGQSAFTNAAGNYVVGGTGNNFSIPSSTPLPWQGQDLGAVTVPGGDNYGKDVFTLVGSGADIGGTADAFHYVSQPASEDCSISAQVVAEEIFNPGAKAGVMIRNSADPADMEASVVMTPDNGILFQWRSGYAGVTSSTAVAGVTAPYWVQLVRTNDTFVASYSFDGLTWTTIGSPVTILMATNVSVGLAVTSGLDGSVSSAMLDNILANAPRPAYAAVRTEGDLIANLQSADLNAASRIWTNRSSNANAVGNFSTEGGGDLVVTNLTWNSQTVQALFVGQNLNHAVQSALPVPAEIVSNNPVSAEAWIFATAVTNQNSCAIGYGVQGGPSSPEEDREFNYSIPGSGGGVSGDFGSYDTQWATTPAPGAWHYLAWTYDGSTVRLYLDGVLDTSNSPNSPLQTPATVMGVGAGLTRGPNLGADSFQGCIAAVRVESGILTPADIATNYALGLLAGAAAVAPTSLVATPGDGQVVLNWDSSPNATGYNLKSATASNGTYTVIATNLTSLGYTNTGLANGTMYYYVVTATNSAGESANSNVAGAEPTSQSPPQLGFGRNAGGLQFTWPQNYTGWNLQMQTNPPGEGIGTNWVTVPASGLTNQMTLPLNPSAGSVFFRLAHP